MTDPAVDIGAVFMRAATRLVPLYAAAAEEVEPGLHALCRARMAQLLSFDAVEALPTVRGDARGHDARISDLRRWPGAPVFGAVERAALAVTEQFLIDPHRLGDGELDELTRQVSEPTVLALVMLLGLDEGLMRLWLALHAGKRLDDPTTRRQADG